MRTDFLRNVIKAPPSKGAQIISAHLVGAPRYICRLAKHEIRGADQAEAGPHEVPVDRLAHVENREGDEYAERDHLLQDLQLGEREGAEADPICRYLQQIFEECDAPTEDCRYIPGTIRQIAQVRVPGDRHE